MAKYVNVFFEFKSRIYSVSLKTTVEDISLAMMEERLYKKLALDESKVKFSLRYMPMVVGCEEQLIICDDEDLFVYLTSIDRENRRCLLLVEEASRSDQSEKQSRVGISSIGTNYKVLEGNEMGCDSEVQVKEKKNNVIGLAPIAKPLVGRKRTLNLVRTAAENKCVKREVKELKTEN